MKNFAFLAAAALIASSATAAPFTQLWYTAAEDPDTNASAVVFFDAANTGQQNHERGAAFNPATGKILVASKFTAARVQVLNANTGAVEGTMDATGITGGGGGSITKIAVAADGAIYACNLSTSAADFKIYRWANQAAVPTVAYNGATSARCGDSFTVTGSGVNTVIYASGSGNANVEVFTTADGSTFTAGTDISLTALTPALSAGDARGGLAIRNDNGNLLIREQGDRFHEISLGTTPAIVDSSTASSTIIGGSFAAFGFYADSGIEVLAAQIGNATPAVGRVWNMTVGLGDLAPIATVESTPSMGTNANGNGSGAAFFFVDPVTPTEIRLAVLSTNNGIGVYGSRSEFGLAPASVSDWTNY